MKKTPLLDRQATRLALARISGAQFNGTSVKFEIEAVRGVARSAQERLHAFHQWRFCKHLDERFAERASLIPDWKPLDESFVNDISRADARASRCAQERRPGTLRHSCEGRHRTTPFEDQAAAAAASEPKPTLWRTPATYFGKRGGTQLQGATHGGSWNSQEKVGKP